MEIVKINCYMLQFCFLVFYYHFGTIHYSFLHDSALEVQRKINVVVLMIGDGISDCSK